jgi:hypothetical protein
VFIYLGYDCEPQNDGWGGYSNFTKGDKSMKIHPYKLRRIQDIVGNKSGHHTSIVTKNSSVPLMELSHQNMNRRKLRQNLREHEKWK